MRVVVVFLILLELTTVLYGKSARKKRDTEAIQAMAKHFETYNQLTNANDALLRFSSADGTTEVNMEETPAFIERVIDMQEAAGLNPTGEVTPELLKEAQQSRCGVSDPPTDSDDLAAYTVKSMWENNHVTGSEIYVLTFSIMDEEEIPEGLDKDQVTEALLSGMCLWESNSNIRFKNIGNDNMMADVTISFAQGDHGDWYSFDGRGGTLAHAFYPQNGRLHFDKAESWYLAKKNSVDYTRKDLFTVSAHELGHTIGLMHSQQRGALMAPIYKYSGTVEEYKLPADDIQGAENMYGPRIEANPAKERGTACYELQKKYGIKADSLSASTTAKPREPVRIVCKDEKRYRKYCPLWQKNDFCEDPVHGRTLRRKCKKTCGFCPVQPMKKKPKKVNEVSKLTHSVCGIERFDSVAVTLDARNVVNMLYFKDDYYFESSLILDANITSPYSLLDNTEEITDIINWRTDPKTIKVGIYKIEQPEMFANSKQVTSVLLTKNYYLAFEKGSGMVHKYSLGTPTIIYLGNFTVQSLFPSYPNDAVDTGFVEFDVGENNDTILSLFTKDLMWQYRDIKRQDQSIPLDQQKLELLPIASKQGVPIENWHGVAACNIDSVITYKGIPYFVKGNIFWPAVDTEPLIPRDLTYNFLRCWQEEPPVNPIPPLCEATFSSHTSTEEETDDPGNSVDNIKVSNMAMIFSLTLSILRFS